MLQEALQRPCTSALPPNGRAPLHFPPTAVQPCTPPPTPCTPALPLQAMNYVATFTQTTEARYPYNGRSGSCNSNIVATTASGQGVRLSGRAVTVTPNSESALKQVRSICGGRDKGRTRER